MSQVPDPAHENLPTDATAEQPTAVLLDKDQWRHVQNRYSLTPRERQIAELVCQGLANGSVAKRLRITPGTVKTHIRNIYRKVRVKSKIAMLLRFVAAARVHSDQHISTRLFNMPD